MSEDNVRKIGSAGDDDDDEVRKIGSAHNVAPMTQDELQEWVRREVATQTDLIRGQLEVLKAQTDCHIGALGVLRGQVEHLQSVLELVSTMYRQI